MYSEDICLQTLTSFSLTRAKSLVRVVGRSSFELVKSFTHGRISNPIFDRCRYSDFIKARSLLATSNEAFQALWIEFHLSRQPNIICGVMYRQHNSPQQFLDYFDETLEKFSALNKPIFIMGDFNINLLAVETCNYAHKFLLSLQNYSLIPTVDKPTRV